MELIARNLLRTGAVALVLLASAGGSAAQEVIVAEYCPPTVAFYEPVRRVVEYERPVVAYYAPRVSYYPARAVSYYDAPVVTYAPRRAVSFYEAPAVSYSPGAVSVTRYGLLGRPRETRTYYPASVWP